MHEYKHERTPGTLRRGDGGRRRRLAAGRIRAGSRGSAARRRRNRDRQAHVGVLGRVAGTRAPAHPRTRQVQAPPRGAGSGSRYLKAVCQVAGCGYQVRVTRRWLARGGRLSSNNLLVQVHSAQGVRTFPQPVSLPPPCTLPLMLQVRNSNATETDAPRWFAPAPPPVIPSRKPEPAVV